MVFYKIVINWVFTWWHIIGIMGFFFNWFMTFYFLTIFILKLFFLLYVTNLNIKLIRIIKIVQQNTFKSQLFFLLITLCIRKNDQKKRQLKIRVPLFPPPSYPIRALEINMLLKQVQYYITRFRAQMYSHLLLGTL